MMSCGMKFGNGMMYETIQRFQCNENSSSVLTVRNSHQEGIYPFQPLLYTDRFRPSMALSSEFIEAT